MNTPQENSDGYDRASVVKAAANLHGKLLLVHGLMDDNVHLQNSAQFMQELQRADKDFEVMIYPRARHPMSGKHYQRLLVEFIQRTLGDPDAKPKHGPSNVSATSQDGNGSAHSLGRPP